jgi:hypothetical protein
MERRDVLAAGALAALVTAAGGTKVTAQSTSKPATEGSAPARLLRVYSDMDGVSHLEELPMGENLAPIPVQAVDVMNYTRNSADWHTAPDRRFATNIIGDLRVTTSDGKQHHIGPGDLVFLEDTTGKGHVTERLGPVVTIFIHLPKEFDGVSWSKGGAA